MIEIAALLMLATWRLSQMLTGESGVFGIFDRFRFHAGAFPYACTEQKKQGQITNVLCCLNCTSVWVAPIILLAWVYAPIVVWILALSAGAIVVKRLASNDQ